jgi:hypothetical protein
MAAGCVMLATVAACTWGSGGEVPPPALMATVATASPNVDATVATVAPSVDATVQVEAACYDAALRFPASGRPGSPVVGDTGSNPRLISAVDDPQGALTQALQELGYDLGPGRFLPGRLMLQEARRHVIAWVAVSLWNQYKGDAAPTLADSLRGPTTASGRGLSSTEWAELQSLPSSSCEGAFLKNPANSDIVQGIVKLAVRRPPPASPTTGALSAPPAVRASPSPGALSAPPAVRASPSPVSGPSGRVAPGSSGQNGVSPTPLQLAEAMRSCLPGLVARNHAGEITLVIAGKSRGLINRGTFPGGIAWREHRHPVYGDLALWMLSPSSSDEGTPASVRMKAEDDEVTNCFNATR